MPRSKIIVDLANSDVDIVTALKRTKVLLSGLGSDELLNWVSNEIAGYSDEAPLPDYRKGRGVLVGSYFKGSLAAHAKWSNVSLPLGKMPDDVKDTLLGIELRGGVDSLRRLFEQSIDGEHRLGAVVPADFFPAIATYNDDPYMIITSARVEFGSQFILGVLSAVENRLLDILLLLEKEFGNLDDLDFDLEGKSPSQIREIAEKMVVIIYNDHRLTIGNKNIIKDSGIASPLEQ